MFGVYKEECKHRFLCLVEVNNRIEECYVASSSHLMPLIDLRNQKVLLSINKGKNLRTKYTLHSVFINGIQILLNLNYINYLTHEYLLNNKKVNSYKIKRECQIENYKSDFFIDDDKKIIIEAKGLLSDANEVYFPSKSGERAKRQLFEIKNLLQKGYDIHYYLILLNPNINKINLDKKDKEFYKLFKDCLKKGLKPFYFKVAWTKNNKSHLVKIKNNTITTVNF